MSASAAAGAFVVQRRQLRERPGPFALGGRPASSRFFSVFECEDGHRWAQRLSSLRAGAFHEVSWTKGAPPTPKLKTECQETSRGRFRICDRDLYDAQMRELLGSGLGHARECSPRVARS